MSHPDNKPEFEKSPKTGGHGDFLTKPNGNSQSASGSKSANDLDLDMDIERDIEPLTLPAFAKLFGVPLIIIATIVGGAVLVVLLFGAPTMPERRSVDSLLQTLESNSGERSLGVLLPREKELWQTALELCERLTKQGEEFTPEELASLSDRLGTLVKSDLETLSHLPTVGAVRENQQDIRSRRLEFTIHALGRTKQTSAISSLIDVVKNGREPYVAVAMRELGDLHEMPETRAAVGPIVELLGKASQNETKLVAATVLSILAESNNAAVVEALNSARVTGEGDVSWSAALALARLGSHAGKSNLLDLLDRTFWEKEDRYQTVDRSGTVRRYRMPPNRIEEWLIAAIDASRGLEDPDVRGAIDALSKDASLAVRAKAEEAMKGRTALAEK